LPVCKACVADHCPDEWKLVTAATATITIATTKITNARRRCTLGEARRRRTRRGSVGGTE
jgi:hypothetical protein